jgi:hypothetical protein
MAKWFAVFATRQTDGQGTFFGPREESTTRQLSGLLPDRSPQTRKTAGMVGINSDNSLFMDAILAENPNPEVSNTTIHVLACLSA